MPRPLLKRLPFAVPLILFTGALYVPNASANAPCGQNSSISNACALDSPATVFGSLTTALERDYYRFYARRGTRMSITLSDMESPNCEVTYSHCGVIEGALVNAEGAEINHSQYTEPVNGVADGTSLALTIEAAGTYYITVYGFLAVEASGKPVPDPYGLSVHASPAVYWPKSPQSSRTARHGRAHGHRRG